MAIKITPDGDMFIAERSDIDYLAYGQTPTEALKNYLIGLGETVGAQGGYKNLIKR